MALNGSCCVWNEKNGEEKSWVIFILSVLTCGDGIKISRNLFNEIQTNGDQLNENLFDMDGSEQFDCFGWELWENKIQV